MRSTTDRVAALVLLAFTAFSLWVVADRGYFGFVTLARAEPWGMQMLIDLVIAMFFAVGWMRGDAKKRGIGTAPYIAATVALGSIGVLAYVVRRGFTPPRGT
jgi:hypothetical protein